MTINNGKDLVNLSYDHLDGRTQLEHAEKIGLGSRKYEIVEI
jgi:uncharacterized Fe-S center protein